jgi:HSP20 family protein
MAEAKKKEERALARPWETINPFDTMREVINRMAETLFEPLAKLAPSPLWPASQGFVPCLDVIDEDEEVRVEMEVPGMGMDDLSVTVGGDTLIVRGEKKRGAAGGKGVHQNERTYGAFRREIPLPSDVDREKVTASFKNGVLFVRLPKSHEAVKKVEITTE